MVGQLIGHYKILDKLGAGGMGEVYRAEDTTLKRQVALKVLPADLASSQERLERFQREAETLAALDHPNIVHIYTVEESEGVRFLTMELVEGESLDQVIPVEGLPLGQFFDLSIALVDALSEAHEQGIVHRDLKPANVMVDRKGRPKILDFGLAKLRQPAGSEDLSQFPTEAMTEEGKVLGTYPYMSPEQVEGKVVDDRSDLFSFGTVLYEMATGKRPFKGDSPASLMSSILRDTPEEANAAREDLPHHLDRILSRCLEKDPDDRYQRAKDLRKDLEELRQEAQTGVRAAPRPAVIPSKKRAWGRVAGVGVLALLVAAVVAYWIGPWKPRITSLAVLPLENLTGDPEQAYLVDGLHEELIATFAQISAFDKIIARTSVMGFRDSDTPVREIGKQLGVEAVLEGSVRRSGDTVRATVQLIDARTESQLWAKSFERELTDILVLQSEVARAVANEVRVVLTPQEAERLAQTRPVKQEAYEAYMKGMDLIRRGFSSEEALMEAIGLFEMAVDIDPTFAPAYVGLSRSFSRLAGRFRPAIEVMPKAQDPLSKALELDENLPSAHTLLGDLKRTWQWDWSGAEAEFRRALTLDPNDIDAMKGLSQYLGCVGRSEEAIEIQRRAAELNPLDLRTLYWLGWTYWAGRRYDESIAQLRKTIELYPKDYSLHLILSWNYMWKSLYDEALEELQNAAELHPAAVGDPYFWMSAASVNARAGRIAEANEALQRLVALREEGYLPPTFMTLAYTFLGDFDRAIEWLERGFEARDGHVSCLAIPAFDPLRDDPRFQDIVRRLNFPEN